ncbi:MAG: nitrogen fixation protein NifH [Dehalococcoidales bacterium]|nr:nitrogen fixation protein NifH [Dehalococcoidales bacterium]
MDQNVINWLLEPDGSGVDYVAMRDLTDAVENQLSSAREKAHREGPIARILSEMNEEGYWARPGPGYLPKYTSTCWSLILLSQLGARADMDERITTACNYYLDHAMTPHGQISVNGTPSQTVDCLQGNMLAAFLDMEYQDSRLDKAFEWMAMTVTGEGISPQGDTSTPLRYYSGKVGPGFQCGANNKLPCAWGAVKVMLAFSKLPVDKRTELIEKAVADGVEFLLGTDPATAAYPCGYAEKPSGNWWKFGFPVFYITDILQIAEALAGLGYLYDPRMANTIELIRSKQDAGGRWPLELDYKGKTWLDFGTKKQPNKWVTLRAMRVLKDTTIP